MKRAVNADRKLTNYDSFFVFFMMNKNE